MDGLSASSNIPVKHFELNMVRFFCATLYLLFPVGKYSRFRISFFNVKQHLQQSDAKTTVIKIIVKFRQRQ